MNIEMPPREADIEEEKIHAERILRTLGLSWKELISKEILDIGAGDGDLEKEAKRRAINITGVDTFLVSEPTGGNVIHAGAESLPFSDDVFDLVLAHAAPPAGVGVESLEHLELLVREAKRVLKEGGEMRFGPTGLFAHILTEEAIYGGDDPPQSMDEIRAKVRDISLKELQKIEQNINEVHDGISSYYSFTKIH